MEKNSLSAYAELTRPGVILIAVASVLLAILVSGGSLSDFRTVLPAVIVIFCITSAGNVLNDYYDLEIDRINQPNRPLPSRCVSLKSARTFAIALFCTGALFSVFLPLLCSLLAIVNSFLLIIYSYLFKRSGFLGNIFVSCMFASVFVFGAAVAGNLLPGAVLAVMAFLMSAAREVMLSLSDVRGDRAGGAKTLPTERGRKKSAVIIVAFLSLAVLFSPIPYLLGILSRWYLVVMLFSVALSINIIIRIINSPSKSIHASSAILNVSILLTLLAFFAGTI